MTKATKATKATDEFAEVKKEEPEKTMTFVKGEDTKYIGSNSKLIDRLEKAGWEKK